jgi:hypothetical protein
VLMADVLGQYATSVITLSGGRLSSVESDPSILAAMAAAAIRTAPEKAVEEKVPLKEDGIYAPEVVKNGRLEVRVYGQIVDAFGGTFVGELLFVRISTP